MRRFSLEFLKIDDENFRTEDLKDEILGPVSSDKLKTSEFNDAAITRKILHLTDKQIESNSISNKAEESVYIEFTTEYEQSCIQNLGSFLRTTRTQEDAVNFVLQNDKSNLETFETPSELY